MNKYEKQRSVHAEHQSFCTSWKLDDGNDFVDEAMSLADDQAIGVHRFGGTPVRFSHDDMAKLMRDFEARGGQVKKCIDK